MFLGSYYLFPHCSSAYLLNTYYVFFSFIAAAVPAQERKDVLLLPGQLSPTNIMSPKHAGMKLNHSGSLPGVFQSLDILSK